MPWRRETFDVDLRAAGYTDTDCVVTVVINPPGDLVTQFRGITNAIAMAENEAAVAAAVEASGYYEVLSQVLVSIRRDAEMIALDDPDVIRAFEKADDPQLLSLALMALWQERTRRREVAAESFRASNRPGLVRATGPSATTG